MIDPKKASLPVQWQNDVEPPTKAQTQRAEQDFCIEAAMRLIENQEAVTRFCCRAAGKDVGSWARGNPTKSELADPYARPNLDVAPAVNVVLRAVASSLLKGDASFTQNVRDLVQSETQLSGSDLAVLAACIAYLRDRVGSPRDLSMPAAKLLKTEAQKEQARPKRPKWRLCFRLDRRMATAKESLEDLAPKYQRDFFLTVIDPPWHGIFKDHPPAPFFASRSACHVADLMASRHMISQLPGRSYEGKAVCVIGAECMTAGLVCAMLGAKVMFVCERNLESYFQHNVRLFRRDTLDYTKTKGKTLLVTSCSPGRNASFGAAALCEKLQVPSIDMIVLTELSAARVLGDVGGLLGRRTEATASGFFRMLNNLVPARSCCKTLVVCDQSSAEIMEEPRFKGDASISTSTAPSWLDENVPPGLAAVLPMDWQARTFCQLPQNIQVIWLERPDAEVVRQRPAPLVNRPPMPPMGPGSWVLHLHDVDVEGTFKGWPFDRRIHMKTPKWLPYSAPADGAAKDVWDALTLMDASMDGSGKIILLYSGYVISPGERDREFQAGWNREHVWPRSKGGLSTRSPGPGTDLHNLHAADISVNSARGNKDFDDLVETDDGVQVVVDSSPPPGYDSMKRLCLVSEDAWAPGDAAKGTVARALMYMACMYADHGLRLVEGHTAEGHLQLGNLSAIRRWAGAFPPSQREKRRNDLAESLQENRNPFIDDPDLCSAVLREARAWADSVSLSKTATSTTSLLRKEPTAGQPTGAVSPMGKLGKVIEPLSARNSRELRETSRITSSKGSRSARGPNIAERHAAPPVWRAGRRSSVGSDAASPMHSQSLQFAVATSVAADAARTSLGGKRLVEEEVKSLEKVCAAYASRDPVIGYCQGMNFVVAVLLLASGGDEMETFQCFVGLVRHLDLVTFYADGFPRLRAFAPELWFRDLEELALGAPRGARRPNLGL
ncbi:unnamed protein product [Durusdinium trenchii]|uniref:Rab-GAP TBC domain-containing protein n=1 Tax=Durusdinium trenchii TaxID=1381693 RepID=A0ABP0NW01_9DINO